MSTRIDGDLLVTGDATVSGRMRPDRPRDNQELETLRAYPIPWEAWRVHDALHTNLPGTPAADDLGLIGGAFGTAGPTLQTNDLKAAGATSLLARTVIKCPVEYDASRNVRIKIRAGMLTTVSDGTATVDVEVHKLDSDGAVGADLVTTAAQTINSLDVVDKEFVINASSLEPGDELDVRVTIEIDDSATATAVVGMVSRAALHCDIRG